MKMSQKEGKYKKLLTPLLIVVGILLLLLTLKTQSVILSDGDSIKVRLDYSVLGLCMRLAPMTDEAHAIASADVFIMDSIENTTEKAAKYMVAKNPGATIEMHISGFPRDNEKLAEKMIQRLEKIGITAKIIEV